MTIKFKEFSTYIVEAAEIFAQNIISIVLITALTITFTIIFSAIMVYIASHILYVAPVESGLSIDFANMTIIILTCLMSFIAFSIIFAFYSSIISIFSFYISFKSEDENYRLFFALIQENFWKVIKVSMIGWMRIVIGTICLVIPGVVLAMRYASINYFVILENANFTAAKIKSAEVMHGFKITLLLFYFGINAISALIYSSTNSFIHGYLYSALYFIFAGLCQGLLYMIYSIIIYIICKRETYKNFVISNAERATDSEDHHSLVTNVDYTPTATPDSPPSAQQS